jgi:hypothetical protein
VKRAAALVAIAALAAAALTGCVKNLPNGAVDWLDQQDGVAEASILADNTGAWSSSGLVRGELDPDIDDAKLETLIGKVQKYQADTGGVAIWLGYDDLDFDVEDGDNSGTVALWRKVLDVDGLASGIVYASELRVRALRPDAVAAFEALAPLNAGVRLEAFTDAQALADDYAADVQYDQVNVNALEFRRPGDCTPDAAVLDFAESLVDRDEIPGATIDLCSGITLDLPATASIAHSAQTLRAELDQRGLTLFPVQLTSVSADATRFAAITPGSASILPVLEVFEADGVPPMDYSLSPDSTLAITAYGVPTADLLALVKKSPAAAKLQGIGLQGDPVSVLAPLKDLPDLLDTALSLDAASDTFGSVELGVGFGSVFLDSGVGEDPDVVTAAADLRASGVTKGRFFSVKYLNAQADIENDVAALADPNYTDPHVLQAFVDAWNAGG